ncbi:MAG: hypothetical protein AMXMBFR83_23010 [Phycisphaerae bacterium]
MAGIPSAGRATASATSTVHAAAIRLPVISRLELSLWSIGILPWMRGSDFPLRSPAGGTPEGSTTLSPRR